MSFRVSNNIILLDIKAVPGAAHNEIVGVEGDRLRIRIASAPERGKANATLCAFLAKRLGCAKKDVVLKSGEKSRLKTAALPIAVKAELEKLIETL